MPRRSSRSSSRRQRLPHPDLEVEVHLGAELALRASGGRRCRSRRPCCRPCRSGSPFCDSVSAQISAVTVISPSSRSLDLADRDLDRVRDLLAGPVAAPARGSAPPAAPRSTGRCGPRADRGRGPRASARRAARPATSRPSPLRALIGKTSSTPSSSAAAASTGTSSLRPEPVDLVDGADHRQPWRRRRAGRGR